MEKDLDRKRKLNDKEKNVKKNEKELNSELQRANEVFKEANERLKVAIKSKDFKELNLAQSLLEVATTRVQTLSKSLEKCQEERAVIDKKKKKMVDECFEDRSKEKL